MYIFVFGETFFTLANQGLLICIVKHFGLTSYRIISHFVGTNFPKETLILKVVASLGDSLLRESDLELLVPEQWINDQIIGFYFEYLGRDVLRSDKVALVSPEVRIMMVVI